MCSQMKQKKNEVKLQGNMFHLLDAFVGSQTSFLALQVNLVLLSFGEGCISQVKKQIQWLPFLSFRFPCRLVMS